MMRLIKQDAKRLHVCSIVHTICKSILIYFDSHKLKTHIEQKSRGCRDLQNRAWM